MVLKNFPALIPALVDTFNLCWAYSIIPHQWKRAAIKLIAKGSATEDATNPGNFRPIAYYFQHWEDFDHIAEQQVVVIYAGQQVL